MKKEEKISAVQLPDEMLSEVTGGTGGIEETKWGFINGGLVEFICGGDGCDSHEGTIKFFDDGNSWIVKCNNCPHTKSGTGNPKYSGVRPKKFFSI